MVEFTSQLLETLPTEEGEKKAKAGATQTIEGIGELRRKIKRNERDYETERRNKSGCWETSKNSQQLPVKSKCRQKNYWIKQNRKSYKHKLPKCLLTAVNSLNWDLNSDEGQEFTKSEWW